MAIISYGPTIAGIRGTLGGAIYSANLNGPYVRAYSKPGNRRTPARQTQRQVYEQLPEHWNSLTAGQRAGWDTDAAAAGNARTNSLGETYFLSGWQWFSEINAVLLAGGDSLSTTAPGTYSSTPMTLTALNLFATGAGTSNVTFPAQFSGAWRAVWFVDLASAGARIPALSRAIIITRFTWSGAATSRNIQTELEAAFGTIQTGQHIQLWHYNYPGASGVKSTLVTLSAIVP